MLWDGQTETGVSVIHMTPRLDGGPCLVQQATPIGPDEEAIGLEARLARLGVEAVREALALLAAWDGQSPLGTPQDPAQVTGHRGCRSRTGRWTGRDRRSGSATRCGR